MLRYYIDHKGTTHQRSKVAKEQWNLKDHYCHTTSSRWRKEQMIYAISVVSHLGVLGTSAKSIVRDFVTVFIPPWKQKDRTSKCNKGAKRSR